MARRATGNVRESAVCDRLDAHGYAVVQLKSSGARGKKMRQRKNPVVGDLLAIPTSSCSWPFHLQVSVGSHAPGEAFREFDGHLLAGFVPLCILYRKRAKKKGGMSKVATARYYTSPTISFPSLLGALEELMNR